MKTAAIATCLGCLMTNLVITGQTFESLGFLVYLTTLSQLHTLYSVEYVDDHECRIGKDLEGNGVATCI